MNKNCLPKPSLWLRIRSELARMEPRCLIAGAVIVLLIGFLSSIAAGNVRLPEDINTPAGTPPAFIFPIVWTILYSLIGAAAGAIFCVKERALDAVKYRGLILFGLMLAFNFIWAPLFFGSGAYFAAFLDIIAMIVLTFFVICSFSRIYISTAIVMTVYLAWLLYAAYLNLGVMLLN